MASELRGGAEGGTPTAVLSGAHKWTNRSSKWTKVKVVGLQAGNVERTGAASRQAAKVRVEEIHVQDSNVVVGEVTAEEIVAEELVLVRRSTTDDGEVTLQQYVYAERIFYRRVIEIMYIAALIEPEEPEEPTGKEKCIDCCCQTITCNFSKMSQTLTGKGNNDQSESALKSIDYMTPVLRRGRSKGWVMHTEAIFPLVSDTFRNVWVAGELIIILVALFLSIATFSLGKSKIFNTVHLILTILGSMLAFTDGVLLLYGSNLFKRCKATCSHMPEDGEQENSPDEEDQETGLNDGCDCKGKGCKACIATTRSIFDSIRMLFAELIFYPLLICDLFELITGEAYLFDSSGDGISFFLFCISLLLLLFFVYIVRIVILIAANYHSQKKRTPQLNNEQDIDLDPSIRRSALYFQVYFVFHVIAQMVTQILMIISIGAKIHDDNRHLFEDANTDKSIHTSGYLWYMLVAGYFLPVFGLLSFFVVTYFWVQEFPIGICIDFLSILQLPDINDVLNIKEATEEGSKRIDKINKYVHLAELKRQFKNLRETYWFEKFTYPFKSLQMVILCMIYTLIYLGFFICAGVFSGETGTDMGPLGGGSWNGFYGFTIVVSVLANLYVFSVALFWVGIIAVVIAIIAIIAAIVIAVLIIYCIALCCLSVAAAIDDE